MIEIATVAQTNLILGHNDPKSRLPYLSQTVPIDVQSAFLGLGSSEKTLPQFCTVGLWQDRRAPLYITKATPAELRASDNKLALLELEKNTALERFRENRSKENSTAYIKARNAVHTQMRKLRKISTREQRKQYFDESSLNDITAQITIESEQPDISILSSKKEKLSPKARDMEGWRTVFADKLKLQTGGGNNRERWVDLLQTLVEYLEDSG